jgi:cytochrome oxidase Cu insertion factor (SCO1/SenC/PrrC family)
MARARIAEANKGIGKPLVGGAFHLTDHNGKEFTDADLKGKYSLVYFGFTHCPDICPEELDKMAGMIDAVKEKHGEGVLRNVFISCDPARDTPEVMKRYLAEFHGDILGMTGTWQEVKDVCKAYRVYFSTPADVKPGQDYLVDHSIYFYLMGEFAECFADTACERIKADLMIQIPRATSSRPLVATLLLRLPRRSSTITFPTGGERSTGHETCAVDVNRDVRLLYTNSLSLSHGHYFHCQRTRLLSLLLSSLLLSSPFVSTSWHPRPVLLLVQKAERTALCLTASSVPSHRNVGCRPR